MEGHKNSWGDSKEDIRAVSWVKCELWRVEAVKTTIETHDWTVAIDVRRTVNEIPERPLGGSRDRVTGPRKPRHRAGMSSYFNTFEIHQAILNNNIRLPVNEMNFFVWISDDRNWRC